MENVVTIENRLAFAPQHTIALVGSGQQENLPLAYLGAAVEKAGHRAVLVRFNNASDRESCIGEILKINPDVVGVSIPFQFAVVDSLELIAALRTRGFKGHITCGGHVPTFCFEQILKSECGIDSVVRHEGEHTLVELLDRLAANAPLNDLPGLVLYDGVHLSEGPLRPLIDNLDNIAPPLRPSSLFEIGGVPISFLLTSRGCIGECRYCSISAFTRSTEGQPYRLRNSEDVAKEVAELYFERDARVFFVQDDLFLLPNQRKTLTRIRALAGALAKRKVNRAMFWIKGRPESVTPEVLGEAKKMGAAHLFLGVEHSVDERLRYLGRRHRKEDNVTAINRCRQAGIKPTFNLMIFDPDCTLPEVEEVVDFAEQYLEIPWNICRTEIYPGTKLYTELKEQGRLQGDYRTYGYTMLDPKAELLFRILRVSLHEHAFDMTSLLNQLISLSFARQIHEYFFPGRATDDMSREVDELISEAHLQTVDVLRQAIRFVSQCSTSKHHAARSFAVDQAQRLGESDMDRKLRFIQLFDHLAARGQILGSRMPYRCA